MSVADFKGLGPYAPNPMHWALYIILLGSVHQNQVREPFKKKTSVENSTLGGGGGSGPGHFPHLKKKIIIISCV